MTMTMRMMQAIIINAGDDTDDRMHRTDDGYYNACNPYHDNESRIMLWTIVSALIAVGFLQIQASIKTIHRRTQD